MNLEDPTTESTTEFDGSEASEMREGSVSPLRDLTTDSEDQPAAVNHEVVLEVGDPDLVKSKSALKSKSVSSK